MGKLKNQEGTTMLVTVLLIAVFCILLVGFHSAIIAMTARLDSTYSEKQTYLYSRSAVTALAQELINLNQNYDNAWEDYCQGLNEEGEETPTRPIKPALLAAVDGLSEESPVLSLTDCTFGQPLVDAYKLDMDITRVIERGEDGQEVEAYELRAKTTIEGMKKVDTTVSILLSTSGKEFEIGQESSGGNPSGGNGSFSGIYTDNELLFSGWANGEKNMMVNGVGGGAVIVGGGDMVYDVHSNISNGAENICWMNDGDLVLRYTSKAIISNVDFYVDGDLTFIGNPKGDGGQHIELNHCNFYVSKDLEMTGGEWMNISLNHCNIYCDTFTNGIKSGKYLPVGTSVVEGAALEEEMGKIPERPKPAWVSVAENSQAISYSAADALSQVPMTAGNVYRLDATVDLWYQNIRNGVIGEATEENPITIIVGDGVEVGVEDSCGANVRFLVEHGGRLIVLANVFYGDVYAYPSESEKEDAFVFLKGLSEFTGTFIVPTITLEGSNNYHYGGGGPVATVPEITTETIRYNLYTNYIYVRR